MQRREESANPYEPPAAVNRTMGGVVRSFQVGDDEIHTVVVQTSLWTGLKTQATDAGGVSGPVHRGPCRFEVGKRERHHVEIEVDELARVNAYVDGKLVEANLFARLRAVTFFHVSVFVAVVLVLVGVFLYLWIRYEPDKTIDRWIDSLM